MAQLIVRNLETDVRDKLRAQALRHNRSMEEEVREILRGAVMGEARPREGLGTRLAKRYAKYRLKVEIPELRGQLVRPVDFSQ